jgi:hypothetical protein
LVTCGVFYKLIQSMGKSLTMCGVQSPLELYNRSLYGLGSSYNDDRYLDEYKFYAADFISSGGSPLVVGGRKVINISKINQSSMFNNSQFNDIASSASTTISASSSMNSLNSTNGGGGVSLKGPNSMINQ